MKKQHIVLVILLVMVVFWAFNSDYQDQVMQQEESCDMWQLWLDTGEDGWPNVPDNFDEQCKD